MKPHLATTFIKYVLMLAGFATGAFALEGQTLTSPMLTVASSTTPSEAVSFEMTASEKAALLNVEKAAPKSLFPFKSVLTPGVVEAHTLSEKSTKNIPAMFVIGDDSTSIDWLKSHKKMLTEIHAVGMITNVESQTRVDAIQEETGWKPLIPVSMEGAANVFQVTHLPFYLNKGGVAQ